MITPVPDQSYKIYLDPKHLIDKTEIITCLGRQVSIKTHIESLQSIAQPALQNTTDTQSQILPTVFNMGSRISYTPFRIKLTLFSNGFILPSVTFLDLNGSSRITITADLVQQAISQSMPVTINEPPSESPGNSKDRNPSRKRTRGEMPSVNQPPTQRTRGEKPSVNQPPRQRRKRGRKPLDKTGFVCYHCGNKVTPEWRRGPNGPNTLCNACGLQYAKVIKKEREIKEGRRMPSSAKSRMDISALVHPALNPPT